MSAAASSAGPAVDVARVLHPARPQLAAVLAALTTGIAVDAEWWRWALTQGPLRFDVEGGKAVAAGNAGNVSLTVESVPEALETLIARGLLPESWAGDEGRAFACEKCDGNGWHRGQIGPDFEYGTAYCDACAGECPGCDGTGYDADATGGRCPRCRGEAYEGSGRVAMPTLPALVALAADAPGVLAAEELARECVARLRPWLDRVPSRVVWRVVSAEQWSTYGGDLSPEGLRPAAMREVPPRWTPHRRWGGIAQDVWLKRTAPPAPVCAATRAAAYTAACSAWWNSDDSTMPDPWAPLAALWDSGYALDAVTPDAVTLVCPALGDTP